MYAPQTLAAFTEQLEIGIVGLGAEYAAPCPRSGDALAPEIGEAAPEQTGRPLAGDPAAAVGGAPINGDLARARETAAGTLSGGKRLGDEEPSPLAP